VSEQPAAALAVIVTGDDALVQRVCGDLRAAGHRVTIVPGSPVRKDVLLAAGIARAQAILALDDDDRVNLEVALEAREANPNVRVVLRQFNRGLAGKIEQNLPNCSVISLAANAAASIAAAAVEQSSFLGLEFPSGSRSLLSFARKSASEAGVAGMSVKDAEQHLGCRILSRGEPGGQSDALEAREQLVLLGALRAFARVAPALQTTKGALGWIAPRVRAIAGEFDPLLRILVVAGVLVFAAATAYFSFALNLSPITAAYFVTATMTTVGYGDVPLAQRGYSAQLADIFLMIAGVTISNLAIAFVAAALVRAQWNALQGLRPVRNVGHIVVLGAGQVGTRVVDYLCELQALVTVVEPRPGPELLRRARTRDIDLLTGDGALDDTLDLCNLDRARSTVVVTNSDATNLEIGFSARARRGDVPVIMRIAEPVFAEAIRKHFEIRHVFSAAALAAPALSDLVLSENARGRVAFAGRSYRIAEYATASTADRSSLPVAAARRDGSVRAIGAWSDVSPDDAVLVLLPSVP
jgi:voltage-gated potassium channel Kch